MHLLSKYSKTFLSLSICVLCHLNIVISVCLQKIFNKSDMNKRYRIPDKIKIKAKSLLRRTKDNPVLCFPSLSNQFLAIDYSIDRFRFCKHNELKAAHTHTWAAIPSWNEFNLVSKISKMFNLVKSNGVSIPSSSHCYCQTKCKTFKDIVRHDPFMHWKSVIKTNLWKIVEMICAAHKFRSLNTVAFLIGII